MPKRSRERVLMLTLGLLLVLFVSTSFVARSYHGRQASLAQQWFSRGSEYMRQGRSHDALQALRTALLYDPGNEDYQLRLAQTLVAAGRREEARAYLANLLEQDPGNGPANLQMARLMESDQPDVFETVRYFHNAIYGAWRGEGYSQQQQARLELAEFLLSRNEKAQAEAETMGLGATVVPEDESLHNKVGELFLRLDDPRRALLQFRATLQHGRENAQALAGAGLSEFMLSDYRQAVLFLRDAQNHGSTGTQVRAALSEARQILSSDPSERGITFEQRLSRAIAAFNAASARLASCAATPSPGPFTENELQTQQARVAGMKPQVSESYLRRHPERVHEIMSLVFDVEGETAKECAPPQGQDHILLLLSRMHRGMER